MYTCRKQCCLLTESATNNSREPLSLARLTAQPPGVVVDIAPDLYFGLQLQVTKTHQVTNLQDVEFYYRGLGSCCLQSLANSPHRWHPPSPHHPHLPPHCGLPRQWPHHSPLDPATWPQWCWEDISSYSSTYSEL